MTELRPPFTFADAMTRVAGVVTWKIAARIAGRTERAVRYWSQARSKTTPTLTQALALDAAYRERGGDGAPFMDTYAYLLDVVIERREACRRQLADEIAVAAQEGGEALANAIRVTATNASPRDIMRALADAEQAGTAWARICRRLTSFLPTGTGPLIGNTGGLHE